ncbi:hypothetical protein [Flavitalea sp.]|nr:hypothetical protein [Flavitalea sp.]
MTQTGKKSIKKSQINNSFNADNLPDESNFPVNESEQDPEISNSEITNSKDNDNFISGTLIEHPNENTGQGIGPDIEIPIIINSQNDSIQGIHSQSKDTGKKKIRKENGKKISG